MKTTAAVLVNTGHPLEIVDLEIPSLAEGQVLVEVNYSGVCHTQLLEWQGLKGEDRFLPHCLGHEGSGTIIDLGKNVTKCGIGDRVILSWMKGQGADVPGTRYQWGNRKVNAGGVTTFMKHAVISENRITPQTQTLEPEAEAFLGCAVATGLGVIRNTLGVKPGESVLVIGAGGIGFFAIAGAILAGAYPIYVADRNLTRLQIARDMGTTPLVPTNAEESFLTQFKKLCPLGVSHAIEATGQVNVMRDVLAAVKPRGGNAVIIGNAAFGQSLVIDPSELNQGKRLLGTWGGDNNPDVDFPLYQQWIAGNQISAELLNPTLYALEEINSALTDFKQQQVTRPIIDMQVE